MDLATAPRSCWLSIFFLLLLLLCLLPRADSGGRLSGHRLPEPGGGCLVASALLLGPRVGRGARIRPIAAGLLYFREPRHGELPTCLTPARSLVVCSR